jgi:hypothetical protein
MPFITHDHQSHATHRNHPVLRSGTPARPPVRPNPKAARRFLEFFTAQINNDGTRKAYDGGYA